MMDAFERAARRELVDYQKLGFRVHLGVFVAVQLLLVATWALTTDAGGFPWFIFPLLGWGIGLAAHFAVYSVHRREPGHREPGRREPGRREPGAKPGPAEGG